MRFCSLSSCSQFGNAYLVEGSDGTRLLVDCGVRIRKLERLLADLGVAPASIAAILMTHDHADHVAALSVQNPFAVKYGIPMWATAGFWQGWSGSRRIPAELRRTVTAAAVRVGGLDIYPFAKPHDAPEPVSYVVEDDGERLVVLTDAGCVPPELHALLRNCEHYIWEANYDQHMELHSNRGWDLIRRVMGDYGHLSNDQAAAALSQLAGSRTQTVLLAHLSLDCNTPMLAQGTVAAALAAQGLAAPVWVAPPDVPSPWYGTPETVREAAVGD